MGWSPGKKTYRVVLSADETADAGNPEIARGAPRHGLRPGAAARALWLRGRRAQRTPRDRGAPAPRAPVAGPHLGRHRRDRRRPSRDEAAAAGRGRAPGVLIPGPGGPPGPRGRGADGRSEPPGEAAG